MDIKTVYGFILLGMGFAFQVVAKQFGINGVIEATMDGVIATGLFLISGIELKKQGKI